MTDNLNLLLLERDYLSNAVHGHLDHCITRDKNLKTIRPELEGIHVNNIDTLKSPQEHNGHGNPAIVNSLEHCHSVQTTTVVTSTSRSIHHGPTVIPVKIHSQLTPQLPPHATPPTHTSHAITDVSVFPTQTVKITHTQINVPTISTHASTKIIRSTTNVPTSIPTHSVKLTHFNIPTILTQASPATKTKKISSIPTQTRTKELTTNHGKPPSLLISTSVKLHESNTSITPWTESETPLKDRPFTLAGSDELTSSSASGLFPSSQLQTVNTTSILTSLSDSATISSTPGSLPSPIVSPPATGTNVSTENLNANTNPHMSTAGIVGTAVGSLVLVLSLAFYLTYRRRQAARIAPSKPYLRSSAGQVSPFSYVSLGNGENFEQPVMKSVTTLRSPPSIAVPSEFYDPATNEQYSPADESSELHPGREYSSIDSHGRESRVMLIQRTSTMLSMSPSLVMAPMTSESAP